MRFAYPQLILVAVFGVAGWQYRDSDFVQDLLHPSRREAARIKFDNGTVRQPVTAQPVDPAEAPAPLGKPRKCVGPHAVSYTDGPCPAGSRELPITKGTMTVLEGTGTSKAPSPAAPAPAPSRSAVRDVLDRSEEQSINEKRVQRIVDR